MQTQEQKEKKKGMNRNKESFRRNVGHPNTTNICVMGVPEGEIEKSKKKNV